MTNSEIFKQYNTEEWMIEQNLRFLLQTYWDEHGKKAIDQPKNGYTTSSMPYSPISFVKKFMKDETLCDVEYAEKSKMGTLEASEVITVPYTELH
jgi:hypothetical protein